MPLQPVRHTYANVGLFKEYLDGDDSLSEWTQDARSIRIVLESASRIIDREVGGRTFGPRVETHSFDLGRGVLRTDQNERPRYEHFYPDYWPTRLVGRGIVPLDDWLISATTVTAYTDTAQTSSTVLTEGVGNDYFLEPYNQTPKYRLKLNETTANSLFGGQKTLTILGQWGWQNTTEDVGADLVASVDTASETAIYVTASEEIHRRLSPGSTLLINSEQVYVTKTEPGTTTSGVELTVVRGVNGSTAATHSSAADVLLYVYPEDVVEVCLSVARNRWREREAGAGALIGSDENAISRPGSEEFAILRRLGFYKGSREYGGVFV